MTETGRAERLFHQAHRAAAHTHLTAAVNAQTKDDAIRQLRQAQSVLHRAFYGAEYDGLKPVENARLRELRRELYEVSPAGSLALKQKVNRMHVLELRLLEGKVGT